MPLKWPLEALPGQKSEKMWKKWKKWKNANFFILTLFFQILTGKVILIDRTIKNISIRERILKNIETTKI